MGNHTFERIRKGVNNYVNKGWHNKMDKKSIAMKPVKIFLQNILSGKFANAEESKKCDFDNVYGDEQKM